MESSKSRLALCAMKISILCHLCESSQVYQKTLTCNSNADTFYLAAWPHWPTCIGENHVCTPVSEQKLVCYIVDIRLCLSVTVAHAHKCRITALLFVTNISIVSIMLKWNTDIIGKGCVAVLEKLLCLKLIVTYFYKCPLCKVLLW